MPRSRKSKKGKQTRKSAGSGPPAAAVMYNGPITPPQTNMMTITRRMALLNVISASGAGSIIVQITTLPSLTVQWSALVGLYTEYRVLAVRFRWLPLFTTYSTGSTPLLSSTLVLNLWRDPTITTPASAQAAMANWPCRFQPIMRPMSMDWRMSSTNEAQFRNTDTPVALAAFTLNCDGLTNSAVYGNYSLEFLIQFRNPN
jgi:hypothetical protein